MGRRFYALVLLALLGEPAAAECGDDGDPGFRSPNGQCVSWCDVEPLCGLGFGDACKGENISPVVNALRAIKRGDPSLPQCEGCGCKGGPGYRGPRGCVGWDSLDSICGSPPTLRCSPEIVSPSAEEAAWAQAEYARLTAGCP